MFLIKHKLKNLKCKIVIKIDKNAIRKMLYVLLLRGYRYPCKNLQKHI